MSESAHPWHQHPPSGRRSAFAWLLVAALHAALAWLWHGALNGPARQTTLTPPQRVSLRLIALRPAPTPLPRPHAPPSTQTSLSKPAAMTPRPRKSRPPAGETQTPAVSVDRAAISVTPHEVAVHAEAPASAPMAGPALLDTEASRRAIRASARTPSLSTQAVAASEEPRPASAQERLGGAVKSAGKGDCLKGDFAGAGMGLLSLPFIVLAAARGACAQ